MSIVVWSRRMVTISLQDWLSPHINVFGHPKPQGLWVIHFTNGICRSILKSNTSIHFTSTLCFYVHKFIFCSNTATNLRWECRKKIIRLLSTVISRPILTSLSNLSCFSSNSEAKFLNSWTTTDVEAELELSSSDLLAGFLLYLFIIKQINLRKWIFETSEKHFKLIFNFREIGTSNQFLNQRKLREFQSKFFEKFLPIAGGAAHSACSSEEVENTRLKK